MAWTNFHSHTKYCDGDSGVEDYIKSAIELGVCCYGYSSHAPVSFDAGWCIGDNEFQHYIDDVLRIKQQYSNKIEIYFGLEIDYIPGIAGKHMHLNKNLALDYFISSIHFVETFDDGTHWNIDHSSELFKKGLQDIFGNNFRKASERFYELTILMVEEEKPDIVGHLDKIKMYNSDNIFFDENDKWYVSQIDAVLNRIKQSNSVVEVNTRGYYKYGQIDLYPSFHILEKLAKKDIPVTLCSDAHNPSEIVSGFRYASDVLQRAGIKKLWSLKEGNWSAFDFDGEGLML